MKDYDAYLFDWDGTLACTLNIWLEEISRQYTAYGLVASDAEHARNFGNLTAVLSYGLPKHKFTEFQSGIDRAAQARLPGTPLYDDAGKTLRSLRKQGKKLALVTTSLRLSLDVVIKNHGPEELFDTIITSEDVRSHKPDPEGIQLALAKLGVDKNRALMLGDTDKDLLAAKKRRHR